MPTKSSLVADGDWTELTNTSRQSFEKEPAEAWLDRVLDLAPSSGRAFRLLPDHTIQARSGSAPPVERILAPSRVEVLLSLQRRARGVTEGGEWQQDDGSAIIFCNVDRSEFLLTRKDDLHPNPRCRGRLALVSGGAERGEGFREGALRELYEEVRDVALADEAAALLIHLGSPALPAVQWPGDYRLGIFLAAAPPAIFARWREQWVSDEILSEALPVRVGRQELERAIEAEQAESGSQFVASQHQALLLALATSAA